MVPTVGFVGYGKFGRALGERLAEAGVSVRAFDPAAPPPHGIAVESPSRLTSEAEVVILAVPVARTAQALEPLAPTLGTGHLVMDVGSVKAGPMAAMAAILGSRVPWLGTHPLFGPTSLALNERPLRVVLCATSAHPDAAGRARSLFESIGCEIVEDDPETHDALMAESHAITYFVAKAILDAGLRVDSPAAPPSARAIARAVEAVRDDAAHLFASLHRQNRYAAAARRRLLDALEHVDAALRAPRPAGDEPHREGEDLRIPDLGARSPRLREARDLIDEIDERILDLLAQRARVALSAAAAKAEIGYGVHDPRREEALLSARRGRGEALGLDPDAVAEVFESVIRFSRRTQLAARAGEEGSGS